MKKTEKKAISVSCNIEDYDLIAKAAEKDHRPVATYVKLAALEKAAKKNG